MVRGAPGMGIRWLALVLSVLSFGTATAALTVQVDRNPIAVDESFTLILTGDGNVSGEPDFSTLEQDFDILDQRRSSSFNIINGRTSQSMQWQLTLVPKHAGEVTIPPINVGRERTQATRLTVTPSRQQTGSTGIGKDLFLEVTAEPRDPYVQQQVIYVARLYRAMDSRIGIANGSSLSNPEISGADAVLERLGDDTQFQTTRNGRRYLVIERRFAIYPQKSGQFTIDPVLFDGRIVEARRSGSPFFGRATRVKRLRSDAVALNVRPVPAGFQGDSWLPATNVKLLDEWSDGAEQAVAGEPVTRTLALMVDGLTSAQIPVVDAPVPPEVKQYPDQPVLNDTKSADGISAVRQQKIALVPTGPGPVTLPPVEVVWWNTVTDRQEIARLPARTLEVSPAAGLPTPSPIPPQSVPMTTAEPAPGPAKADVSRRDGSNWWPWLSLALGLGWLLTALAWWGRSRERPREVLADGSSPSPGRWRRELKRSCQAGDLGRAKTALLEWAKACWPQQAPASLGAVARQVDGPLAAALEELSRVLYSNDPIPWDGEALWQAFQQYKPMRDTRGSDTSALAPLFEGE